MYDDEHSKKIEAVMFALGREITVKELSNTLKIDVDSVENAIIKLKEKYSDNDGVCIVKIKDAYQLVTNKKYYEDVSKFIENTKKQILSTSVLETLTIIAYNPKITKAQIESIRGVNSDFAVNRLLECGLIEEVARLNLPGRPAIYSVTSEFLKCCGIENVSELPDFEKIKINDEQLLISDLEENSNIN